MVSLPPFLRMAEISYDRERRTLQQTKGYLSSLTNNLFKLIDSIGEMRCPEMTRHGENPEKWGEVLYKLAVITSFTTQDLEVLTNDLRVADGMYPIDYSDTKAARILQEWNDGIAQMAEEMGVKLTADGKLVRS